MSPRGLSQKSILLPLAALCAFFVATALSLGKPGLPSSLRADEAAYLLQSSSLAVDGDLLIDSRDIERLFADYPYGGPVRVPVFVEGADAAATSVDRVSVDRPLLYAFLAAPWRAIFGIHGPLALNMLLAHGALLLLVLYFLRMGVSAGHALTTAVAAIGLSAIFPYLFQHHPAALWAMLGCLVLVGDGNADEGHERQRPAGKGLTIAGGASWALLASIFPSALAVLPALLWRAGGAWKRWSLGALAGGVLGIAVALIGAQAPFAAPEETRFEILIEQPGAYSVASVTDLRVADLSVADLSVADLSVADLSVADLNRETPKRLAAEAGDGVLGLLRDTFFEQRRGLLPYFPLVLLGLVGAALSWRRFEPWRWLLLGGLLVQVTWRATAQDPNIGGGLLGDPGQAAIYPLFFLLAPALPALTIRLGLYGLATLCLGAALVSSLGPAAAYGDPQVHTRGGPLSHLPLSLENVGRAGIYRPMTLGGPAELDARLWWPAFAAEEHRDELWLLGGEQVMLYLDTRKPVAGPSLWRMRNLAPQNVVRLRLAGENRRVAFPAEIPPGGQGADIEWPAVAPIEVVGERGEKRFIYPLRVITERGLKPAWQGGMQKYYVGVALTFLGPRSHLERDVFAASALGCGAPPEVEAGETFQALVRLRNESQETWNRDGAVSVRLAYRWRHGERATQEGPRTELRAPVGPGEELSSWLRVTAPKQSEAHRLVIDLVYESVAFFADRQGGEPLCDLRVTVAPSQAPRADG